MGFSGKQRRTLTWLVAGGACCWALAVGTNGLAGGSGDVEARCAHVREPGVRAGGQRPGGPVVAVRL